MTDRYTDIADALIPLLGGADNIDDINNCMTRLRVSVVDPELIQGDAVRAVPGVLGVVEDETYQIVLGPGAVTRVAEEFRRSVTAQRTSPAGAAADTTSDAERLAQKGAAMKAAQKARNNTPMKNAIRKIANIFVPLIPALIGAGIILAIRGLLANWQTAGGAPDWLGALLPALNVIGSAFLGYLAVFAGINAAKEFGGTPALGGAVAAIIVVPAVANIQYTLPLVGQVHLSPGQGGVIGAIFAAGLCAWLERLLRGRIPDAIDILVTPTVALLVSGLATIYVFIFVAGVIASAIGAGAVWLLAHSGVLAGFVLGGTFLPLVMLGLHQALVPIHATLIEQLGFTPLLTILSMAGAGQVGAAVVVWLKLKRNRSLRRTIKGALPVGVLGVGEPLIYGVSLPLGRPFITACIGGAFGGAVVGAFNQFVAPFGATAIGPSGLALLPLLQSDRGQGYAILAYVTGLLVGYLAGFVATWFWGMPPQLIAEHNRTDEEAATPQPARALTGANATRDLPAPASPTQISATPESSTATRAR
ncbi:PTS transporter subunit EIIC [Raineyella sp. LH-20]|uniref:PTS transporter subunit EIIC n=1 Tax=Raineyella sp. LH-20 TaxID=3081204 RepID=UPI002953B9F7|nr:PTS transporter subunit EIIC [Raineyella sp. LH-20]WOP18512.1 PTS transporter subunit EIIC [Raineyella sp. LH-20]